MAALGSNRMERQKKLSWRPGRGACAGPVKEDTGSRATYSVLCMQCSAAVNSVLCIHGIRHADAEAGTHGAHSPLDAGK